MQHERSEIRIPLKAAPLRILMLEDSLADAELNAYILRKAGLEFTTMRVEQRDEFLSALLEFKPDLVLADYHLPQFDGLSALTIVREQHPHLPFIFVTGAMGEETAVDSLHNGASDYLLKDRLARLPEVVARALEEAEIQWQLFRAEQLLEESEARFRSLVETTSDWIWEINDKARYIYSSPAVLSLLGYAAEEVIGRTPFELMPPGEADWISQRFADIAAAHQPIRQLENVCLHRDGRRVIMETSAVPVFSPDGTFSGYRGIDRDITQRKLAERSLRDSEMKFRLLSENAADCIFWTAPNGHFLYVSPACKEIFGYDPEDYLADPDLMARIVHPEDKAAFQAHMHNLPEADEENLEYRIIHRDGSIRWISHHCRAIYDADGICLGRRGSNTDITARKQAEEALRQSEQRYHAAVDSVRDAFIVMDSTDGSVLQWNPAAEQIFGYGRTEMIGRNLHDVLVPLAYHAAYLAGLPEFSKTGQGAAINRTLELTALHKDGHEFPIELSLSGIQVDGHWQAVGIIRDISARKRDSERLASQARLAQALLELPRAAEKLDETAFMRHGLELAEDLTGSQIAFIHFVHDDQEAIELVTWSRRTVEHYCHAAHDKHYPISQAGIWADALRQRGAVMVNDYVGLTVKHGLPEGHAPLDRLISVPVIENGLVRMLTGVGNKAMPYSEMDVETVQLVANEIWRILRQRRAEQALRESEMKFRSLYDSMTEGMALHKLVYDASGAAVDYQLLDVNPAYEAILGLKPEQVIGRLATQVYNTGTAPFLDIYADVVRTGHPASFEGYFEAMQKTFAISTIAPSPGHFATLFSDITDRIKTETMLRKLAQAVEQSPESVVITDLDANIEYVNETFIRNSGYSREEVIGRNPRILHSGKTPKTNYQAMWNAMRLGLPWQGEFINKRKNGSEYVEFAIITPLRQPDGSITHYVAVKEDITEKKQNALELDQHRLHLEDLVESRTLELTAAREEAERLARVKSDFLANMSHEIRTPLNAVLGFAQIGQRDSDSDHNREIFGRILDSGQLLLRVVNDILDFSKIEAGKLDIEKGRLHPGVVLDRCAALMRDSARNKGLTFQVDESADLPESCDGDDLRVTQVLMNLLTNAIKFTQHGGVTLSARKQRHGNAESLILTVTDTGIGMSEAERQRLFLPFEQADSSTTRRFGGTGLGLAISKRLLALMEGSISVSSQPGHGSVFEVRLPLSNAEGKATARLSDSDAATVETRQAGQRLQGLSILAAEDNEVNRMVLAELLSREGCRLTQVENGRLAVDLVRSQGSDAFDLVLMDIQMPGLDGYAATREIKAYAPNLPVIGLTAHALAEERDHCLAAGMVDHVAKPIVLPELIKAIRSHVKGWSGTITETETSAPAQHQAPPQNGTSIDWRALEWQYRDNREFLDRLLQTISLSNQDKPAAIESTIESRDFTQLAFITHSLKGMAGDILPSPLRDLAILTEAAARNEHDEAFSHAEELAADLTRFLDEINTYLMQEGGQQEAGASNAEDRNTYDAAELDALLDRLAELLKRSDASANTLESRSAMLLRHAFGAEAERLDKDIQSFDYEAALERLLRLQQSMRTQADTDKS